MPSSERQGINVWRQLKACMLWHTSQCMCGFFHLTFIAPLKHIWPLIKEVHSKPWFIPCEFSRRACAAQSRSGALIYMCIPQATVPVKDFSVNKMELGSARVFREWAQSTWTLSSDLLWSTPQPANNHVSQDDTVTWSVPLEGWGGSSAHTGLSYSDRTGWHQAWRKDWNAKTLERICGGVGGGGGGEDRSSRWFIRCNQTDVWGWDAKAAKTRLPRSRW